LATFDYYKPNYLLLKQLLSTKFVGFCRDSTKTASVPIS
jgi:hypothetical protein